jgi:hypothetical protein
MSYLVRSAVQHVRSGSSISGRVLYKLQLRTFSWVSTTNRLQQNKYMVQPTTIRNVLAFYNTRRSLSAQASVVTDTTINKFNAR